MYLKSQLTGQIITDNPFEGRLPLEIWLIIKEYKERMELAEIMENIHTYDEILRKQGTIKNDRYEPRYRRSMAQREYYKIFEQRRQYIKENTHLLS